MDIILDISKTFQENLDRIFEKYKKLKKRLEEEQRKREKIKVKEKKKKGEEGKKEWYEKFRWFFTSNNFLVIAGRDKNSNEQIIRKYLRERDIVVHADIVGSPFGIIRVEKEKQPTDIDIYEACQFVASYSRAWKAGLYSVRVFWVYGHQVSKRAPSGEYLPIGSFMIYGKKNFVDVELKLAIGIDEEGKIVHGVPSSVSKRTKKFVVLIPGAKEPSKIAEKIAEILGVEDKNEILRWIPSWGAELELD